MKNAAKNIAKVSAATIGSRILGLVRDAATMAYMSIGAVSAAYTFAFTLPNLFRRLLGEGALTSALIPVFSQTLKDNGTDGAFAFLNKALTRAGIALAAITIAGIALCFAAEAFISPDAQRLVLSARFAAVLMPYLMLICLAALFSAVLNVLDSFGVPSITPALLNIAIIGGLFSGVAIFGADDIVGIAYCMCAAWLVGGALQLGIPAYWLRRKGWRFSPDLSPSPELKELTALFTPALIGAAVIQVNIFVSKTLAILLSDSALPALYLSSRILEFPLGVFTVAIATVYFPKLACLASARDETGFKREYSNGMVMTMCISVPAMCGLEILGKDILTLLFEWGLFNAKDVDICLPVLAVSILGLPFFSISTYATRGFHSSKDTITPVKISCWSFATNIILSLALMWRFGAAGLAAANVAAAALQAVMLNRSLKKVRGAEWDAGEIAKVFLASAAMSAAIILCRWALAHAFDGKILAAVSCALIIPAGAAFYFGTLKIFKFKQISTLERMLRRK